MKPELVIDERGAKYWYLNGQLHREDGPAVVYPNGTKHWYIHGTHHREDGPAIIITRKYYQMQNRLFWFINGKEIHPHLNLIEIPQTEDEMLEVFNQYKFVKYNEEFYFVNQYIKEFKKEWYEKYKVLFK